MKKSTWTKHCYMVIDVETDLPMAVFDTYREVQEYLEVSSKTLARLLRGASYMGMTVEKIML